MEKDKRRRFSKTERIALANAADWKSELSGQPLDEHFHVDHIYPYSQGGSTSLSNAQVLTSQENLRKGAKTRSFSYEQLRDWQQRFVDAFRKPSEHREFLLAAVPGSGKTIASLYAVREFLEANNNRRALIVVPTDHLRSQWRDVAFEIFRLSFETEFSGKLHDGFVGLITTYQQLARSVVNFNSVICKHEFIGIGDEIHHLSEIEREGITLGWSPAFKEAFSSRNVRRLLLTSGTPIRTDGERIPFLRIESEQNEDGSHNYHLDHKYDYPAAIRDKVLRRVTFTRYGGRVDLLDSKGQPFSLHTDDNLSETLRQLRLTRLIKREEYAKELLKLADTQLNELRRKQPAAGGLVLCIDSEHAGQVGRWLKEITGESPDIVVTNDEVSTSTINDYKKSKRKWIVAVRMVSEGVDIRRLSVLAFLTNCTTEIFFRQAIGRIIRHGGTKHEHAFCFIPSDPELSKWATIIEEFQALIPETDEEKSSKKASERGEQLPILTIGASPPEFNGLVVAGESFDANTSSLILEASIAANITPDESATAWAVFAANLTRQAANNPVQEKHPEDERRDLSKDCTRLTVALAYQTKIITQEMDDQQKGKAIGRLTTWVSGQSNTPNPTECSLEQMRAKHQWLSKELQKRMNSR